jgi:hypothetical protein
VTLLPVLFVKPLLLEEFVIVCDSFRAELLLLLEPARSRVLSVARASFDVTIAHDFLKSSISDCLSLREILYFFLLTTKELGSQFVSKVVLIVDVELIDVAVTLRDNTDNVSVDANLCSICWPDPVALALLMEAASPFEEDADTDD